MSVKAKDTVTLRRIDGSHPRVIRVYAFDKRDGTALVLLRFSDGAEGLDRVEEGELEAFYDDDPRSLANVHDLLILRAAHVLNYGK